MVGAIERQLSAKHFLAHFYSPHTMTILPDSAVVALDEMLKGASLCDRAWKFFETLEMAFRSITCDDCVEEAIEQSGVCPGCLQNPCRGEGCSLSSMATKE
jgi:hypothetical protein